MARETIPAQFNIFKGLNVDIGNKSMGCMKRIINMNVYADGSISTRKGFRVIKQDIDSSASKCRGAFEFIKEDGTKYIIVDIDHSLNNDTITKPSVQPGLSQVTFGGTASNISSADFNIVTKETLAVYNERYSSDYEFRGCDSSLWPNSLLSFTMTVDSIAGAVDPQTGEDIPTVKINDGSSDYRQNIPCERVSTEDDNRKLRANIGKCQKMDYGDLWVLFENTRGLYVGEHWTWSLNLMDADSNVVDADNITHDLSVMDDVTPGGAYTGTIDREILVKITTTGTPDKFSVSYDRGLSWESSDVSITGAAQSLGHGVTATFANTTGHLLNSYWYIYATAADYPIHSGTKVYYTYIVEDDDGNVIYETDPSPVNTINITTEGDGIQASYTGSGDSDVSGINFYKSMIADNTDIRFVKRVANGTSNTNLNVLEPAIENNAVMETDQANATDRMRIAGVQNTSTEDKITCGTWNTLVWGLVTTNDPAPQYENAHNRAYRQDGQSTNLVFSDVSGTWLYNGITPPTLAPTSNTTGGVYKVYYIYVREESDRIVRSNPSPVGYCDGVSFTANIKASLEPGVTAIWIYRSLKDTPTQILKLGSVSNVDASITYAFTDEDIALNSELEFDNYLPYKCKFAKVMAGRMYYYNVPDEADSGGRSWGIPSKINEYEHMTNDILKFDAQDGDQITGVAGPIQDKALVFKKEKTFFHDGISNTQFTVFPSLGCCSWKSIQEIGEGAGAIWLSNEGVIYFDAGDKTNISRLNTDSQGNVVSGGVNSIIIPYIKNDTPYFCDSAYYPRSRQYHLLLKDPDDVTDQRYLIYHLDAGQWTEYEFYNDSNVRLYVHAILTVNDGTLQEALTLIMSTTGFENNYSIYQGNWDPTFGYPVEIMDSTGANSEILDKPLSTVVDSNDNIYVMSETNHKFFKIDDVDAKTFLFKDTDIISTLNAELGYSPTLEAATNMPYMAVDSTYFYFIIKEINGGNNKFHLMKSTFSGTLSYVIQILSTSDTVYMHESPMMFVDQYLWVVYNQDDGATGYTGKLVRVDVSAPGSSIFKTFLPGISIRAMISNEGTDTLYLFEVDTYSQFDERLTSLTTEGVYTELLEFDLGYDFVDFDTRQLNLAYISDIELFFSHDGSLHRFVYSDSAWTVAEFYDPTSGSVDKVYAYDGALIYIDYSVDTVFAYSIDTFGSKLVRKFKPIMVAAGDGTNTYNAGTAPSDNIRHRSNDEIILTGYNTDNVWKTGLPYKPFKYLFDNDGSENFEGVVGEIEMYMPLGFTEKRFREAHILTDSLYSVGGILSIMNDDRTSETIHTRYESSVPSNSISSSAFVAFGEQPWETGNYFTKRLGTRTKNKVKLAGRGHEFYVSLKIGNLSKSSRGQINIYPMALLYQELGRH